MGLVKHKRVARLVELSGGYTRAEACKRLTANHGMVASFSRALVQEGKNSRARPAGPSVRNTCGRFRALRLPWAASMPGGRPLPGLG